MAKLAFVPLVVCWSSWSCDILFWSNGSLVFFDFDS